MDLLIVRHAHAGESDFRKWPDDGQRPLSKDGVREFRKVARRLATVVPRVDAVWSSALVRAWQTAEILAEQALWPKPRRLAALEPGGRIGAILESLAKHASDECVVLVGHEPDLGRLIALLVGGDAGRPLVDLKKGSAALLRVGGEVAAGQALLAWMAPPRVLLGERGRRK